jgi:hypothetical protein
MEAASRAPITAASPPAYSGAWCCRKCLQPMTVIGDPEWGLAVHTATGEELGDDAHLPAPIEADFLRATAALRAGAGS